jgi:hypothetical protein
MSTSSPEAPDIEVLREQRRKMLLRHVRARRALLLARRTAVARTAVLLRSIGYHER